MSLANLRAPLRRWRGFTMVELMIVVAIIAILAAIAYPSYLQQVRKQRRAQAKADLSDLVQSLERSFTTDRTYGNFQTTVFNGTPALQVSPRNGTTWYNITMTPAAATTTYTLTATPINDQLKDPCGTLSITQQGVKSPLTIVGGQSCW